jgi:hypothetical protein
MAESSGSKAPNANEEQATTDHVNPFRGFDVRETAIGAVSRGNSPRWMACNHRGRESKRHAALVVANVHVTIGEYFFR